MNDKIRCEDCGKEVNAEDDLWDGVCEDCLEYHTDDLLDKKEEGN